MHTGIKSGAARLGFATEVTEMQLKCDPCTQTRRQTHLDYGEELGGDCGESGSNVGHRGIVSDEHRHGCWVGEVGFGWDGKMWVGARGMAGENESVLPRRTALN